MELREYLLLFAAKLSVFSLLFRNINFKIQNILIFLLVLHLAQTLSLTLEEVHRLRIFENRAWGVEDDIWAWEGRANWRLGKII